MARETSLSKEQILSLVQQVFPQADIVSAERFTGNHTNSLYDIHLVRPAMNTALALKVYANISTQGPEAPRPWKEVHLLRLLTSETGVPVPRVLHFDDSASLLDVPWVLYTRLPGEPLSLVLDSLDEWELESIGYEMGRYLAHIHQIPLPSFGEFFGPDSIQYVNEKEFVIEQLQFLLDECVIHNLIAQQDASKIEQLFETSSALDRRQACLMHGDYTAHNVMVERGLTGDYHVTGILDLSSAIAGSLEQDMSKPFNNSFEKKPTLQKGFLDGYTDIKELGPLFWERIGLYRICTYLQDILAHKDNEPQHQQWAKRLSDFVTTYTSR
jgi:Ser/Thr protein kinase RdoA (MazF antagonist)